MSQIESITCGCGAKLTSDNPTRISDFDRLHGSAEHVQQIIELKYLKYNKVPTISIVRD